MIPTLSFPPSTNSICAEPLLSILTSLSALDSFIIKDPSSDVSPVRDNVDPSNVKFDSASNCDVVEATVTILFAVALLIVVPAKVTDPSPLLVNVPLETLILLTPSTLGLPSSSSTVMPPILSPANFKLHSHYIAC